MNGAKSTDYPTALKETLTKAGEFLGELESRNLSGLSDEVVTSMESDLKKAQRIVDLVETINTNAGIALSSERVQEIMGANFISAHAYEKFGWDVEMSPLPEGLTEEMLSGDCPVSDGAVTETNRLVVVPGGKTAIELAEAANKWCEENEKSPAFYNMDYLRDQDWAQVAPEETTVALMAMQHVPNSYGENDQAQQVTVDKDYPDFVTADPREGFFALIMDHIENDNRNWSSTYGRFQNNVLLGYFDGAGLLAARYGFARNHVGRAVSRKLKS